MSRFEAPLYFIGAGLLQPTFVFASLFGVTAYFRRRGFEATLAVGGSLATGGIVALAVFWLAWWRLPGGHTLVAAATIVAIVGTVALACMAFSRGQWRDETAAPIAFAFIATLVLLLWVHAGYASTTPLEIAATRWTHALPIDNNVPLALARDMGAGRIPIGPSAEFGWMLSSDRPPLQTAMFLLTPGHLIWGTSEQAYQAGAVAFQMLSLVGAWTLARSIGAGQRMALGSMAGVFFTPIVLVNGGFVWPKLLAATFLLVAVAIHFSPPYSSLMQRAWCGVLVGSLGCLAMLSHPATAFALIGIAISALILGQLGSIRYLAGALVAFALIYAPWVAYQKFVNPPGDWLIKWHLAGVTPSDPRGAWQNIKARGAWQTIEDSYAAKTWAELISARESNFAIVTDPGLPAIASTFEAVRDAVSGNFAAAAVALKSVRDVEFFFFIPGTGLLGFALYLLPIGLLDRRTRGVTLAIILSLVAWIVLMFLPSSTTIHAGSLFPEIALIIVTIAFVAKRSQRMAIGLIAAQVALTTFQYTL